MNRYIDPNKAIEVYEDNWQDYVGVWVSVYTRQIDYWYRLHDTGWADVLCARPNKIKFRRREYCAHGRAPRRR